jgi:hypothetical protein
MGGIGSVCLLLQWAGRIPTYWPVGIAITAAGIWAMNRWLKRIEQTLRNFGSMNDLQSGRFLLYGTALILVHATKMRFL